jgi:peptide/nickel transport system permease protein
MTMPRARLSGILLLLAIVLVALAGPYLSPHDPARQFPDAVYAPPMRPHLVDASGRWRTPFVYPLRLDDRLTRRYSEDLTRPEPLRWFTGGALIGIDESRAGPWLPLGGDALGRDILGRTVAGARLSLGVSALAAAGALLIGALIGAAAGYRGGRLDDALMRMADLVLVLPAIYVVLVLRAAMPLRLTAGDVFWTITGVLVTAGWPYAARGVRAIVAAERRKEYAEAAQAIGAGSMRILLRHLLPAATGFLAVQATLLLPSFILAEATLSFVGLGFPEPTPSWGVMLQDAGRVGTLADAPWLLTPAAAIVVSVLALHLAGSDPTGPLQIDTAP